MVTARRRKAHRRTAPLGLSPVPASSIPEGSTSKYYDLGNPYPHTMLHVDAQGNTHTTEYKGTPHLATSYQYGDVSVSVYVTALLDTTTRMWYAEYLTHL